jgi:5-formyltetrahydrofolate cyclo-ligase
MMPARFRMAELPMSTIDPPLDRRQLRDELRARRRALPPRARLQAADAVAAQLQLLPELSPATRVAGYWAVDGELSLHALMPAIAPGAYCLPCVQPDRSLLFAPWRLGEPLQANRFGIPEPDTDLRLAPEQLDVVLVPLVGFDRRGNRLGSGAGFYDRSFAFLRGMPRPARPLLVGIGYAAQEIPRWHAADWDVPLDRIATEHELIDCCRIDA